METISTFAIIYSDGYGGFCVIDESHTHQDIIEFMNEESIFEVFESSARRPKGKYKVSLEFWWESSIEGRELVIGETTDEFISDSMS